MTKKKDQNVFNNKYSNDETIEIVGSSYGDHLKIENFTNLKRIKLKKLKIISLKIINCSQLIELDCSNTTIEELSLNLCPNITKLKCSNNNKLINIDVSNCSKLEFLDCSNCSNSKFTRLDLSNCPKSIKTNHPPNLVIIREKEDIRNLFVVGRTGSGKSTLCNVLAGTDEFKESNYTNSQTNNFKKKYFERKGTKYCVVDTVGFSHTNLTTKVVLDKIIEGIYSMPDGICQVLFVVDGGFTAEEMNLFLSIKNFMLINNSSRNIFAKMSTKLNNLKNNNKCDSKELKENSSIDRNVLDYITIVRTKFTNFRNNKECETDKRKMCEENKITDKIIKSCRDIIHVDNPPIDIIIEEGKNDDGQVKINENVRTKSREKLLKNLETIRQERYFKLKSWDELYPEIVKYMEYMSEELSEEVKNNPELQLLVQISPETHCLIL
ncbi:hypothetical protein C1645_738981 [Glomus cerebriforme]|uniref:AIG1-type G domain-containing protein n=1 Tax=Glomus cerebriforme TaxID=658196 RepID=A0A397SYC6_9GLOM|nr:hypothetical protein C1645_738981 [Glomus cerebriforme]